MVCRLPLALLALLILSAAPQAQQAEALIAAIQAGDVTQVRALLEAGADADARLEHGEGIITPLGAALGRGGPAMLEIVDLLLEAGADPDAVYGEDGDPTAPLLDALGYEIYLHLLGQLDTWILWRRLAAAGVDDERVRHLVDTGAELNFGRGELVRRLLDAGADPGVTDCRGGRRNAAELAAPRDPTWPDLVFTLQNSLDHILVMLARAGADDVAEEPELRVRGAVEAALLRGDAPLHAAVFAGDAEAVERLLNEGHDPRQDMEGRRLLNGEVERFSPLGIALGVGQERRFVINVEVVRLLLAAGADPEEMIYWSVCRDPYPALWSAVQYGRQPEVVRALLEAGAPPDEQKMESIGRFSPLLMAVGNRAVEMVRVLLEAGADPNIVDESDYGTATALVVATRWEHAEIVRLLLEAGADPNLVEKSEDETSTALQVAVERGNHEIVQLLRAAGADVSQVSADAFDPFFDAFASCEPGAGKDAEVGGGFAAVRYEILGPEAGRCRVSMTYITGAGEDWLGRPLTFLLDPATPFHQQAEEALEACWTGELEFFDCQGPLLEQFDH